MHDPTFEQFVGDHLPALGRYAYALTGSVHAAEDLVQDTLVKLVGAWHRVRHDGAQLGYARTVMFRTFVSRWRVLRRRPVLTLDVHDEPAAAGDAYATVDSRQMLRTALRGLPRLQRAVLVLGYLDDLSDQDIAELLDRRPATIRSLRQRGLAALRAQLQEYDVTDQSQRPVFDRSSLAGVIDGRR